MADTIKIEDIEERVVLVGVSEQDGDDADDSLSELAELVKTAGATVVGTLIQRREKIHPGTYVGTGKVAEIAELVESTGATGIVCDDELSPAQQKNLEMYLDTKVMDRTLVILDIFMPGMDGLQLLAKIREQEYDVDVIIVSAANDKDKIKAALRLGAFDYIIKPFEFERFNLALNNYKSRYNLVEEQSILKQDELDKTIIHQDTDVEVTLPKGLDKNTLNTVWSEIIKIDGMFTTEEISAKVGISRVSIRKYLEFLKSLKLLSLDLHRGSVGRPVYKYKCIDKNANIIDLYIQ